MTVADQYDGYEDPPEPRTSYDGGRVPPQNVDAERYTLGAMLLSKTAIDEIVSVVHAGDFYQPSHEVIFNVILDLYSRADAVDVLTVMAALQRSGELAKCGGAAYLHTLSADVPIAANGAHYAAIVAEASGFRRLTEVGTQIVQRGYAQEGEMSDSYDAAMSDLLALGERSRGEDYVSVAELLPDAFDAIESAVEGSAMGVPTGFYDFDELTHGLHPGQMIVVAGRPAMGKSTLAMDWCRAAAIRHGRPTAFMSLEMGRSEIMMRLIAAESKVALNKVRSGVLSEQDWASIARHADSIGGAPLWIDDSPNLTMAEIAAKARRLRTQHGLELLVIDYLQLMSSGKKVENRQVEVSEFSRQIKLLAKELKIPIVALSQLNRGPEQRTVKRPMMSDLRESGSIEQDSDLIVLVHRDDAYEPESARPGEADLIVAKHRNGATKDVVVAFQGHYARFVDIAR